MHMSFQMSFTCGASSLKNPTQTRCLHTGILRTLQPSRHPNRCSPPTRHFVAPYTSRAVGLVRLRPVMAGNIEKLSAQQLEVAIQERDRPIVIDFYATWCGPCVLMAEELEKVAEKLGNKIRIVKVDTDDEPDLSSQLQIQGLPTLVFVGTGSKPALRTEGLLPADAIVEIIQDELM